jgi:hypothetical protein
MHARNPTLTTFEAIAAILIINLLKNGSLRVLGKALIESRYVNQNSVLPATLIINLLKTGVPEVAWQEALIQSRIVKQNSVLPATLIIELLKDRWVTEGAWQSPNPEQICEAKLCDASYFDHHLLKHGSLKVLGKSPIPEQDC